MREPEGIGKPPPGNLAKGPGQEGDDPHIRNVEAVGSNPITSTKVQVNGLNVGSPTTQMDTVSSTSTL